MNYIQRKKRIKSIKGKITKLLSKIKYILYPLYLIELGIKKLDNKIVDYEKSRLTDQKVIREISKIMIDYLIRNPKRTIEITNAEHINYDYKEEYETLLDYSLRKFKWKRKRSYCRYLSDIKSKQNKYPKEVLEWNIDCVALVIRLLKEKGVKVNTLYKDEFERPWAVKGLTHHIIFSIE